MAQQEDKNLDLIERFFSKNLSGSELEAFNTKVQQDLDFAQEVNLYRSVHKTATIPSRNEGAIAHQVYRRKRRRWLASLLSLVVIGLVALVYFNQNTKPSPPKQEEIQNPPRQQDQEKKTPPEEKKPSKSKEPVNDVPKEKNPPQPLAELIQPYLKPFETRTSKSSNASELYRRAEYDTVIIILVKEIPDLDGSKKAEAGLLLGTSLIFTNQYPEAIEQLNAMLNWSESKRIKEDIKWYLAFGYLLSGEQNKGKELLLSLNKPQYKTQAKNLLDQLAANQ